MKLVHDADTAAAGRSTARKGCALCAAGADAGLDMHLGRVVSVHRVKVPTALGWQRVTVPCEVPIAAGFAWGALTIKGDE